MLRYMLDTNIVIYIIKNKPEYIRQRFNQLATQLCVSSITVAELIYGAKNSQYPYKNMEKIVVTNNTSEFERVSALQVENWITVET